MRYQIVIQFPEKRKEINNVYKNEFCKRIKRILENQHVAAIGHWAHEVYLGETPDDDVEFLKILLILNYMEDGPEFEMSYERLNEIADDLIAGKKDINMDY